MAKRKEIENTMVVEIKEKVDELFSDTSVSQRETLSALMEVRDHVQMQIEAIEDDLRSGRG